MLILTGIEYNVDDFPTASAVIFYTTATSNPVAVAQFFDHICKGVFDDLLHSHTGQMEILGQVSNHYEVVETNGHEMLHLHALVWLTGNIALNSLRDQILQDDHFANRVI